MKKNMVHAKCPKCKQPQNHHHDPDIWHKCLVLIHSFGDKSAIWTCKFCGAAMRISGSEVIRYSARKV